MNEQKIETMRKLLEGMTDNEKYDLYKSDFNMLLSMIENKKQKKEIEKNNKKKNRIKNKISKISRRKNRGK